MTVANTSLDAYFSLKYSKIENIKTKLLSEIKSSDKPSNKDLARTMKVEINRITPRVNELVKEGRVVEGGIKVDPETHRHCKWWKVVEEVE